MKAQFIDKDLNGLVIKQNAKDSKSVEIEGNGRFAGHRFLFQTKLYGDKKCLYCGKWFHWMSNETNKWKWISTKNIDDMNVDTVLEPLHCDSEHCREYHRLYLKAQEERLEQGIDELFRRLKQQGAIR